MAKKTETHPETGATVTSFDTFCFCPKPDLNENDVCRKYGTKWK